MLALIGKGIVVLAAITVMATAGTASIGAMITVGGLGAAWMFLA